MLALYTIRRVSTFYHLCVQGCQEKTASFSVLIGRKWQNLETWEKGLGSRLKAVNDIFKKLQSMGLCLKCIVHSYHNSISCTSTLLTWRKYGNKCDCAFSNQKLEDSVILQKETACSQDWRPSFPLLLILWSPVRVTFSDWLTNLLGMLFFW